MYLCYFFVYLLAVKFYISTCCTLHFFVLYRVSSIMWATCTQNLNNAGVKMTILPCNLKKKNNQIFPVKYRVGDKVFLKTFVIVEVI